MPSITLPVDPNSLIHDSKRKEVPESVLSSHRFLSLPVRSDYQKQDEGREGVLPSHTWSPFRIGSNRPKQEKGAKTVPELGSPLYRPWSPLIRGAHPKKSNLSLLNEESSEIPQPQSLAALQKPASPHKIQQLEPQEHQEQKFSDIFGDIISCRLENYYRKRSDLEPKLKSDLELIRNKFISKYISLIPALVQAHNLFAQCNEAELRNTPGIIETIKEGSNKYNITLTQTPPEEKQNITIIDKATGDLYIATFLKQGNDSYKMQCTSHSQSNDKSEEQLFTKMCELVQAEGHIVDVTINRKSIGNVFGYTKLDTLNEALQPGPNRSPTSSAGRPIQEGGRPNVASA